MARWFSPNITLGSLGAATAAIVSVSLAYGALTGDVKALSSEVNRLNQVNSVTTVGLNETQLDLAVLAQTVAQIREINDATLARLDAILSQITNVREDIARLQALAAP